MAERLGIMGGSFDPIHLGHLIIAQDAIEQFGLDKALFAPARQSPLKGQLSTATPEQRWAMTKLAVAGNPNFEASDVDLRADEISYSIDTTRRLRQAHPSAELFWILGADQVAQLHHWRSIEELCALVAFIVFAREGDDLANPKLPSNARLLPARSRQIQLSSTEIRERLKTDRPVKYFLPAPVFDYIKAENLYR